MKIAIMGYPGGGKTFLSKILSAKYEIPIMHLDEVKFDKQWSAIDDSVVLPQVTSFMEKQDWIIEGNYASLLQEQRLDQADQIVLILLPRIACLFRALKRTKLRRREGYKNDINPWFLYFVLIESRNREQRKRFSEIIETYGRKVVILKTQKQIDQYVQSLRIAGLTDKDGQC